MPGVFAQTVVFGAIQTGIGLAEDLHKGLIERFRSLPMARSAVLAGRTLADLVRNVFVDVPDGRRSASSSASACTRAARARSPAWRVMLLFGFSLTWIFAIIGLSATNAETAQAASFPILAPLVFASSAFVVGRHDAGLAAGLREAPAGVDRDRRDAVADARRDLHGHRQGDRVALRGASASSRCSPRSPCAATARPRNGSAERR